MSTAALHCRLLLLLACVAFADRIVAAEQAASASADDALAAALVSMSGIHIGVCELPRVGDGRLAAALARQGIGQVHGLARDAAAAAAARAPAAACGVLGTQVVIEEGQPAALPLGEWVADALFMTDVSDATLGELPPAEARRVLAPYRGMAVIGRTHDGHGALSKAALAAWAAATGGTVHLIDDASGLWAVVRMPALAGGDDWSHHIHAADGDLVSDDKQFGAAPYAMQWTGKPYFEGHWDIHVVSAGRLFSAQASVFQRPDGVPFELVARSAYNGQVLWRRPIAQDLGEASSLLVATPDRVFIKDKNRVLVLDPETGAERGQMLVSPDETRQCLLLLVSDGVLVALTGPVQHYGGDAEDFNPSPGKQRAQDLSNELYEGSELSAWDIASGVELWNFQEAKIDPSKIAINDGHVYLYAARTYAACLSLTSGKQIWKTHAPIVEPSGPGLGYINGHATVKMLSMYRDGAIATHDAYMINYLPHRHCQAFAATDGHLLWDKMHGPRLERGEEDRCRCRLAAVRHPGGDRRHHL